MISSISVGNRLIAWLVINLHSAKCRILSYTVFYKLKHCYSISSERVVWYPYVSPWLAGYEILAFEKPCLHYHKISTESQQFTQGVNGNEPIENMQLYMGYSLEKLELRLGLKADIMRMHRLLMLITCVLVKIQVNLQERSWDTVFKVQ